MNLSHGCTAWRWRLSLVLMLGVFTASAQAQAPPKNPPSAKAPTAASEQPKFKAIWEPVNVPEDLELVSVHFATPEEGWVAGGKTSHQGGVIYHTADGGKTWKLQAGDPQSSDGGFSQLRFLDGKRGFAVQLATSGDHQLFATSDGQTWAPAGTVPEHRYDYLFTTPTTGFLADHAHQILRTTDGGGKWQPVYTCRIKADIGGLTREADCHINDIHFPTATVGYAIGGPLAGNGGNVLAKTEDGGATWTAWVVLPGESSHEGTLRFLNADTGVFRAKNGKLFRTGDGGKTWTGVSGRGQFKSNIVFANADVGWMMYYRTMTYSTNAGRSWVSREIAFPAMVADSTLPAPDRGYAAGEHGMVYRYRVVPIDYNAKGMLPAPSLAVK